MTRSNLNDLVMQCELAGLLSESGTFDRPYQGRRFRVPAVIGNDCGLLLWHWDNVSERNPLRPAAHGFSLLKAFINLADAPVKKILAFARKWGVLEICMHGLPCTHNLRQAYTLSGRWCTPLSYPDSENFMEPITYWHFYAKQMRALVKTAARLKQGMPGLVEDWKILIVPGVGREAEVDKISAGTFAHMYGRTVEDDRVMVRKILDRWLSMGDVRPNLVWDDKQCSVSFDNTLFGMLAMQVMLVIFCTGGLAFCSGCAKAYSPRGRRPKVNRRNYCQRCGKPAALRDAQAALRCRKRAERSS